MKDDLPLVNICIPVYHSSPGVPKVLDQLLISIKAQSYPNIVTIASVQHSDLDPYSNAISNVIRGRGLITVYRKEGEPSGPAVNTNSAMSLAHRSDYIKIMNQDDFLNSPTVIEEMVTTLENSDSKWLASACIHTHGDSGDRYHLHTPHWPGEKNMVEGVNCIGCPSVVMFDSSLALECDPDILYAMDCDMWIQLFRQAGLPIIYNKPNIVVRVWENQLTSQLNIPRQLEADKIAMRKKYGYV